MRIYPGSKVNLSLRITGRLPNGYHTLDSIFFPLASPHDTLDLIKIDRNIFALKCEASLKSPNILQRTWEIFSSEARPEFGVEILLKKNIPVGAGLGGGSSDAACFLDWLNKNLPEALPETTIQAMAASIGADVPFFLFNKPARATGIGEILEPLNVWPEFWLLLVWPEIPVSTASVFQAMDISDNGKLLTNIRHTDKNNFLSESAFLDLIGQNDLEAHVTKLYPMLDLLKKRLLRSGADSAAMSGSGSSFFGVYFHAGKAKKAYAELQREYSHTYLEHFPQNDMTWRPV